MADCPDCRVKLRGTSCPCGWVGQKRHVNESNSQYYDDIQKNKSSPETSKKWLAKMRSKIGGYIAPKSKRHDHIKFMQIPDEIKAEIEEDDKKQEKPNIEDYYV